MIIKSNDGFIIYNTRKHWDYGHSHLRNYNACISAIKLADKRQLPRNHSKYFVNSLIRISQDNNYIERLKELCINYKDMMEDANDIDLRRCW